MTVLDGCSLRAFGYTFFLLTLSLRIVQIFRDAKFRIFVREFFQRMKVLGTPYL